MNQTRTEQRITALNRRHGAWTIIPAGKGWQTPYLIEDRQTSLCTPIGHHKVYLLARRNGIR